VSEDATTADVEVREGILKKNDLLAGELRERFHGAGVFVVSLVSSPGAGKTAFLERTLTALRPRARVAALVGDRATERDAERLRRSGAGATDRHWHRLPPRRRDGRAALAG
jgi:hydrogenase nickel incorporation protein HypB